MPALSSDTVHEAVFVELHTTDAVLPERSSCGVAVIETEGTGGGEH
jgi:hypothetical protein